MQKVLTSCNQMNAAWPLLVSALQVLAGFEGMAAESPADHASVPEGHAGDEPTEWWKAIVLGHLSDAQAMLGALAECEPLNESPLGDHTALLLREGACHKHRLERDQLDPDNWVRIPELGVMPLDVWFKGFAPDR